MRLHVLAGCRDLLRPEAPPPEQVAALIGPQVRPATAFWLAPDCGLGDHALLQEAPGDRRTAVFAGALKAAFGRRFEPLIVLPELLDEPPEAADRPGQRSQRRVLAEIRAHGAVRLRLWGLALAAGIDPEGSWAGPAGLVGAAVRDRLERLRVACAGDGEAVETGLLEAAPDDPAFAPIFARLYGNAVANQLARRLVPRLRAEGWAADAGALGGTIAGILADRAGKGLSPALPLHAEHLDAIATVVHAKCL